MEAFQYTAGLLQDLRQWKTDQLIDGLEFDEKRLELASALKVPSSLDATAARHVLAVLKALREGQLLTEEELKSRKREALAALRPGPTRAPSVDHSGDGSGRGEMGEGDQKYFGYYGDFAHQELMLNDTVRTGTYHQAILGNRAAFEGKVVMDVGCGTGVLALFAAMAGARKVYAVEASGMAGAAEKMVAHNRYSHIVTVVRGKIEEVEIPERVDVLVSEPLGFWLLNEQMLQSYVAARDRFLKPGGKMFPCHSKLFMAPSYLPEVRRATVAKSLGWTTKTQFYGLDFTCLEDDCRKQNLGRVIVDQVLPSQICAPATETMVDLTTITVAQLNRLQARLEFNVAPQRALWDSVVIWFDTYFPGTDEGTMTVLPTAPDQRLTCWYQSLFLLPEPIVGSSFCGTVTFVANAERTYDLHFSGGPVPGGAPTVQGCFGFTHPVYRYYEHFGDLLWDPAQFPVAGPLAVPLPLLVPPALLVAPAPPSSLASNPALTAAMAVPISTSANGTPSPFPGLKKARVDGAGQPPLPPPAPPHGLPENSVVLVGGDGRGPGEGSLSEDSSRASGRLVAHP
eukprot:RCo029558